MAPLFDEEAQPKAPEKGEADSTLFGMSCSPCISPCLPSSAPSVGVQWDGWMRRTDAPAGRCMAAPMPVAGWSGLGLALVWMGLGCVFVYGVVIVPQCHFNRPYVYCRTPCQPAVHSSPAPAARCSLLCTATPALPALTGAAWPAQLPQAPWRGGSTRASLWRLLPPGSRASEWPMHAVLFTKCFGKVLESTRARLRRLLPLGSRASE